MEYAVATLNSLLANIYRDTKKNKRAYTPLDFMPKWDAAADQIVEQYTGDDTIFVDRPYDDWQTISGPGEAAKQAARRTAQSPDALRAKARMLNQLFGGTVSGKQQTAGDTPPDEGQSQQGGVTRPGG